MEKEGWRRIERRKRREGWRARGGRERRKVREERDREREKEGREIEREREVEREREREREKKERDRELKTTHANGARSIIVCVLTAAHMIFQLDLRRLLMKFILLCQTRNH